MRLVDLPRLEQRCMRGSKRTSEPSNTLQRHDDVEAPVRYELRIAHAPLPLDEELEQPGDFEHAADFRRRVDYAQRLALVKARAAAHKFIDTGRVDEQR